MNGHINNNSGRGASLYAVCNMVAIYNDYSIVCL